MLLEVQGCQNQNDNKMKMEINGHIDIIFISAYIWQCQRLIASISNMVSKFRAVIFQFLVLERRLHRRSNQMEPGSSNMTSPDDVAGSDSATLFDSFEEMDLHPLECHQIQKSKRSRDGENTRVRSKDLTVNHAGTMTLVILCIYLVF